MNTVRNDDYAARFAQADGSADNVALIFGKNIFSFPLGAYQGEVADAREKVFARTLSGEAVAVSTGARRVLSSWSLRGLPPDKLEELSALLVELSAGAAFRLLLPEGRVMAGRLSDEKPAVVLRRDGAAVVSFEVEHSPADPDLVLAANFDGGPADSEFLPDWSIVPVSVETSAGVQLDTSETVFGAASLRVVSGPLIYGAASSDPAGNETVSFFYKPDYGGSPSQDRVFLSRCDSDGGVVADFAHLSTGRLQLRSGNGQGGFFTYVTSLPCSMSNGTWVHLAASVDKINASGAIFVDGQTKQGTGSGITYVPIASPRPGSLVIGAGDTEGAGLSTGRYDCFRISSRFITSDSFPVPEKGEVLA